MYVVNFLDSLEKFISLEKPIFQTYNFFSGKLLEFQFILQIIAEVIAIDSTEITLVDERPSDYQYSGSSERLTHEIGVIGKHQFAR